MKTKWLTGVAGIVAEIAYALLYILAGLAIAYLIIQSRA